MKKIIVFTLTCLLAVSAAYAAGKTTAKTSKTAKKPTIEITVVEAAEYASGKQDEQVSTGLAGFLEGTPKVTTMDYQAAQQDPKLANLDYSFLPLYLVKKTPAIRKKLEQHIAAGYVQENDEYIVFPHLTRTGVYAGKAANPDVLEIFVMSHAPMG
jgi:hypothetical protein